MKLNRRAILVIVIGVFLVVLYSLNRGYSARTKEREELSASLSGTQPALARLISQRETLANQVSQLAQQSANITAAVNKAKASYPGLIGSIEYGEILFRLASQVAVQISSLSTSEPSEEKVDKISYWATNFSLSVTGKPGDVFAFVNRLANDAEFATASINSVSLSPGAADEATVSLALIVYGRKE